MTKFKYALPAACVLLLTGMWLSSCDQGTKKVYSRYKHVPGMISTFQQITRGLVKVEDRDSKRILQHEYMETTMDITNEVLAAVDAQQAGTNTKPATTK